jgi:purine-binding chemotaxis protein CheW
MPDLHADCVEIDATARFLSFRVDGRAYALRADDVGEVIRVPPAAHVPESPAALVGLANLRGLVLPIVSLRRMLGLEEPATLHTARAIVLNIGSPMGLVVDAVDSLVSIARERVETRQAELGADAGEPLTGAFEAAPGRAIKILDVKALLDATFAQRARNGRRALSAIVRSDRLEQPIEAAGKAEMLVTFEVADQEFALALRDVQEVLPAQSMRASVPRAESLVLGITSLRGALLPLLSLRGLLGFPVAAAHPREKIVVMKVHGVQVGLVADRARAMLAAEPRLIDPIPAVLAARTGGESRIRAIYRGDGGRRLVSILAPEHLFREDIMQRLTAHRDEPAMPPSEADVTRQDAVNFLVFRLGRDEFALPIEAVDEVAQVPAQITRMPKTPRFLEGVINLRGSVVPVIDQRRRFDMPKREQSEGRRLVVVRTQRYRAALIVDSVSDVLRIAADTVEPPPELTEDIARLVHGVINLEQSGRIVLVLDPAELLTRAERRLLDSFGAETVQDAT